MKTYWTAQCIDFHKNSIPIFALVFVLLLPLLQGAQPVPEITPLGLDKSASDKTLLDIQQKRVEEADFGRLEDGTLVKLFTMRNKHGVTVKIMSYGATIVAVNVPDRSGEFKNVVLGADTFETYLKGFPAAASVIGRYANRIGKARFTLDGVEYKLPANSGQNHIHGGNRNFAKVVWQGKALQNARESSVRLTYFSKGGEEGFPGNLTVSITYTLTDDNELVLTYEAQTDKPTVINLTNHAYWNLAGEADVLDHLLWLSAERYTLADDQLIPTGEIASVKGTALDFTSPEKIGARIGQLKPRPGGYDHNYVLSPGEKPMLFARVTDPKSGRIMEVSTTEPGVQLYTANHVRNLTGAGGAKYKAHAAYCLETQHYPDSPNKPAFPSTVLRPGHTFKSTTIFKFSAK